MASAWETFMASFPAPSISAASASTAQQDPKGTRKASAKASAPKAAPEEALTGPWPWPKSPTLK